MYRTCVLLSVATSCVCAIPACFVVGALVCLAEAPRMRKLGSSCKRADDDRDPQHFALLVSPERAAGARVGVGMLRCRGDNLAATSPLSHIAT